MSILHRGFFPLLLTASALASSPAWSQESIWIHQDSTTTPTIFDDAPLAVIAHGDGGVWTLTNRDTINSVPQSSVSRFAADGRTLGESTIHPGAVWNDFAKDGQGGAYLIGHITGGTVGGPALGFKDILVAHVDSNAIPIWTARLGASSYEDGIAIVAGQNGGILIACETTSGSTFGGPQIGQVDTVLARLDGSGNLLWARKHGVADKITRIHAITVDVTGIVHAAGSVFETVNFTSDGAFVRYDLAGTQLALDLNAAAGQHFQALVEDGMGGFYALIRPGTAPGSRVARFDSIGLPLWNLPLPANVGTTDIVRLANGTVLFLSTQGPKGSLVPLMPDGTTGTPYEWPDSNPGYLHKLDSDGRNTVAIAGGEGLSPTTRVVTRISYDPIGQQYCTGQGNSTGSPATMQAIGSQTVADQLGLLHANGLPAGVFGFFLCSQTQGFHMNPGGSQGNLCLGGFVGRFNRVGEILTASSFGTIALPLDMTDVPTPIGPTSILAGQTWHFQAWHRDSNPGPTSNFSSAIAVPYF